MSSIPPPSGIGWDDAADDYARHRAPFPDLVAELLVPLGVGGPGRHVVDLGSGIGTPALELARAGARVTAVDPSARMLEQAAARAADAGLELETHVGTAEATGLPALVADAVTAGQSWHWFDPVAACVEIRRLLRPAGRVALCQMDWQPDADGSGLARRTLQVVADHATTHADAIWQVAPRRDEWTADVTAGGFEPVAWVDVSVGIDYTPDSWRGRLRASTWGHGSKDAEGVAALDAALATALESAPARFTVPHALRILVAAAP